MFEIFCRKNFGKKQKKKQEILEIDVVYQYSYYSPSYPYYRSLFYKYHSSNRLTPLRAP